MTNIRNWGFIFASICVLAASGSASAESGTQSKIQLADYSCEASRHFSANPQLMLATSGSGSGSAAGQFFALLGDSTSAWISNNGGPSFLTLPEFGAQSGPFAAPSYDWWDKYYALASYSGQYLSSLHLCDSETAALSPLMGPLKSKADVPEPGSWILMLTGVALLGLLLRMRPHMLGRPDCAPA